MANQVALSKAQILAALDAVSPNVQIDVTWSDSQSPIRTDTGTVLSKTGSLVGGNLEALLNYSFGSYPLPPADKSLKIYRLNVLLGAGGGMGAAVARAEKRGGCGQLSHTDPRTWGGFIEGCESDQQRMLTTSHFITWMRARHGIPNADRNAPYIPNSIWENAFIFHRHNGILRAITCWVEAAQNNKNWYDDSNLALAEELVAEAEMFLVPKGRRSLLAKELGGEELQGKVGRAVNRAYGKKSAGADE
jgi:hypothetical protein